MKKIKLIILLLCVVYLSSCSRQTMLDLREEGIALYENSEYEEAIEKFDAALKMGDGEIGTLQYDLILYKAECEYKIGNYSKSKDLYKVLLTIDKNNKTYEEMYNASVVYEKLIHARDALDNNELNTAEKLLNDVRNSGYENDRSYLFNEIILAEKRNMYTSALNLANQYLKIYPNDEVIKKELEFINIQLLPIQEPTPIGATNN